ncbi:TPA: helix-turn-helix domain-containing protein [Pasteurella multocida]
MYELHERNITLHSLSIKSGLAPSTLKNALRVSYPKGERIIAAAIGVAPQEIWATRYAERENRLCG